MRIIFRTIMALGAILATGYFIPDAMALRSPADEARARDSARAAGGQRARDHRGLPEGALPLDRNDRKALDICIFQLLMNDKPPARVPRVVPITLQNRTLKCLGGRLTIANETTDPYFNYIGHLSVDDKPVRISFKLLGQQRKISDLTISVKRGSRRNRWNKYPVEIKFPRRRIAENRWYGDFDRQGRKVFFNGDIQSTAKLIAASVAITVSQSYKHSFRGDAGVKYWYTNLLMSDSRSTVIRLGANENNPDFCIAKCATDNICNVWAFTPATRDTLPYCTLSVSSAGRKIAVRKISGRMRRD